LVIFFSSLKFDTAACTSLCCLLGLRWGTFILY